MGATGARHPLRAVTGVTLDTGALIAIERGDRRLQALLDEAAIAGAELAVPAGVVAQAWRGSSSQARLARFLGLAIVTVVALDDAQARAAGALCGRAGTADVIDASVVLCARARDHAVITGDPNDLATLDPALRIVAV
jgi:predicted nucleic acid-binding protein